jgi:ABC-type polysaccharide/polyol phosphate export permease
MNSARHKSLVYDSANQTHPAIEELRGTIAYRHLILQLIRRDILTRYKRSVLGVAWTFLNPLGMMLVLTLAFSQVFARVEGYPAYVLSGLVTWNFFGQTTMAAMVNLVWGGGLLHRIYIPRGSFALAAIGTGLVNIVISLVPLIAVMLFSGVPITFSILLVPIPIILLGCFALGLGLLLSTFAVYFPDVKEMYQIALTGWMYLTPVIYPEEILPEAYRFWVTTINPMYYFVKLFRIPTYFHTYIRWEDLLPAVVIALVTLVAGWWIFSKQADEFAYRV